MIFPLTMFLPWREKSQFTIIAVISKPHLWSNHEDFLVVNDDSTVIDDVLVSDRPRL